MTESEVILWSRLRRKQLQGVIFYRQKPIGRYIVDFYCPSRKLVIEIDGGQHYDAGESVEKDKCRDSFLRKSGLRVLRFTNRDVKTNLTNVVEMISEALSVNEGE